MANISRFTSTSRTHSALADTSQFDAFDNEKVEKVEIVIDGSFSIVDQSSP